MKYYVVFKGHNPGVYDNWDEVKEQTNGFPGAMFKSFATSEEASEAYRRFTGSKDRDELARLISSVSLSNESGGERSYRDNPEIDQTAWAVDASCLKNPGIMEYRGVDLATGKEIFRVGPFEDATNNIGEYLALVHALSLMAKIGEYHNIYSDSRTAMSWLRRKGNKSTLQPTTKNARVFELLKRADLWVQTHNVPVAVRKGETERWGEIPADFGRK